MGWGTAFKFAAGVGRTGGGPGRAPASPHSSGNLASVVIPDTLGYYVRAGRDEAMRIPAAAKGRALICGTLSRQPLAKFRDDSMIDAEPWMFRTDTQVPPQTRMTWTLDDLIWHGRSLWAVDRDGDDAILDAIRVPPEWWSVDDDLSILIDGQPVNADEVIYFDGPQEGLLALAQDQISADIAMARAWSQRVTSPVPLIELHLTDASMELTSPETRQLAQDWNEARRCGGGTAVTPASVQAIMHGQEPTNLFIEGRNASRLDWANYLNLPGTLLDGSTATASLTYSTQEGRRNELVDYSLAYWATPIEARLSMDDVCPKGERVAFDLQYLSTPTQPAEGPASED